LADTYGHILRTKLAEVDFKDVVLNRRILVVLLPALEKSPDELSNLGKIVIASLKAMMAAGLGEEVEGDYQKIVANKPTNAPTPFLCILDEYGYYAVEGFAVVPAQARSLGFSVIFAGQDLPAFQKASKEEAASIGANTNIKICMKLEDPTETWDFFTKTAGEAYVTKVDAFQTKDTSISNSYLDTKSSSFEKRARVDLLDLKDQTEGMAHIFFKSQIVRARLFYANPKMAKVLKLNQFVKVDKPDDGKLYDMQQRLLRFKALLDKSDIYIQTEKEAHEDITLISEIFTKQTDLNPIDRGIKALLEIYNRSKTETESLEVISVAEEDSALNIFTELRLTDDNKPQVDNLEQFSQPLLLIDDVRPQLSMLEKLSGKVDKYAHDVATEIVKDMKIATNYPPTTLDDITPTALSQTVTDLVKRIRSMRKEAKQAKEGGKSK